MSHECDLPQKSPPTYTVIWCNNLQDPRPSGGGIKGDCEGFLRGLSVAAGVEGGGEQPAFGK